MGIISRRIFLSLSGIAPFWTMFLPSTGKAFPVIKSEGTATEILAVQAIPEYQIVEKVESIGPPPTVASNMFALRRYSGEGEVAYLLGYYVAGDGGGGAFAWVPSDKSPDDGGVVVSSEARGATRGRWHRIDVASSLNVRWFGARGDGKSNDLAAFKAAHAVAATGRFGHSIYVPPGNYILRGQGLKQTGGIVVWHGVPEDSLISLDFDGYFLSIEKKVQATNVYGLTFLGGKGAFQFTHEGENVSSNHSFVDCVFKNYSKCAIGNNSSDHPYLKVERCVFHAISSSETFGIAWGGNLDKLSISNSRFSMNGYHIKIGPRLSGAASIIDNDFISFAKGVRIADIWVVPNQSYQNAGVGIVIQRNKFGNENMLPTDVRILVAQEQDNSGQDRQTRRHSEEWSAERSFVEGVIIAENRISGVSGSTSPFMLSYVKKVTRCIVRDNLFDGGLYQHFVEFSEIGAESEVSEPTLNWKVDLAPSIGGRSFLRGFSNRDSNLIPK